MEYDKIKEDIALKIKTASSISDKEVQERKEIGQKRSKNPVYLKEGVRGKDLKRMKRQQKQVKKSSSKPVKRKHTQKT